MKNQDNLSAFFISVWIMYGFQGVKTCSSVIRQEGPAIQGRYVRLVVKPSKPHNSNQPTGWTMLYKEWATMDKHSLNFTLSDNHGDFILDVKLPTEPIKIYAEFGCRTLLHEIVPVLVEISKCGLLYLEPKQFKPGTDIRIRYFPHRSITQNPRSFNQTWKVVNHKCKGPLGCVVSEKQGVFEMSNVTFYDNPEFVLKIIAISTERDGTYLLQCDATRKTDGVEIVTPVRPSQPVILNQREVDKEGRRIVGVINKALEIDCETHGGTNTNVTISIDNFFPRLTDKRPRYSTQVTVPKWFHGQQIRCEVMNMALESPLFAEATLYVTVPPGSPTVTMGDIKEGEAVDVSCRSEGGRPIPSLIFNISNIGDAAMYVTEYVTSQGGKNFSIIHLKNIERSWNGQTLTCCTVHPLHKEQCSKKTINYLFTPEKVSIEHTGDVDEIKDVYTLFVTCTLWQFSAKCQPVWKLDNEIVRSYTTDSPTIIRDTKTKNYTQSASITVTKSDNRKQLTCVAICAGLSSHKNASFAILVPYEPIIKLDTPSQVNVSIGESFIATCTADSHPPATVTWRSESTTDSPNSEACGQQSQSACLRLEPVTRSHSGKYTCVAKNSLSQEVPQSITVNVQESSTTGTAAQDGNSSESSNVMVIVIAVLAGVVAVVILIIAIVVIKKKRGAAAPKHTEDRTGADTGNQPGTNSGGTPGTFTGSGGDTCYASISDNDTYAQPIPKAQRPTASAATAAPNSQDGDTYSTPLPKSQRANAAAAESSQQDGDTYSTPLPKSQRVNAAAAESSQQAGAGKKEMIYADLDLDNTSQPQSKKVERKDGDEVEYMAIDFTKKAEPLPPDDDDTTEENVYANQ